MRQPRSALAFAAAIHVAAGFTGAALRPGWQRTVALPTRVRRHHFAMVATAAQQQQEQEQLEQLRFLTPEMAEKVRSLCGTPTYAYDLRTLKANARACLNFPAAFGLTVRYAMKAWPNAAVLQLFSSMGIKMDASSGWEARRAIAAGIPPEDISLSTQELPADFAELHALGVKLNACSLAQLDAFGRACPGADVGVRFNPGLGSGGTGKTNVGGPGSSFGVWHEQLPRVQEVAARHKLRVVKVHTHIGSGSDPAVWQKVSGMSLDLVRAFPEVTRLNLGGGYKVARMSYEAGTDMQVIGAPVKKEVEDFARETGRKLHLEIEPGTFLVATAGALVTTVQDKVNTGADGRTFLKLDAGMTDLLRPSLYGAQQPIVVLAGTRAGAAVAGAAGTSAAAAADSTATGSAAAGSAARATESCVVVGHCCESGDLLTPAPGAPDDIAERRLAVAEIGDLCVVEGCGAYVSGMSAKNYNSFPEAPEALIDESGAIHVIRRRQRLDQIFQNEVAPPRGVF